MGEFAISLAKFRDKFADRSEQVVKKLVFEIGTSLVLKSPVGDADYWSSPAPKGYVGGRFRANWQLGVGAIDRTTTENVDKTGETVFAAATTKLGAASPDNIFYWTNTLPYAKRLEEGWSRQAPNGMVRLTKLEFQAYVDKVIGEVKQGGN